MTDLILENKIPEVLMAYNDILSKGFDGHHFIAGLASHFRDLLVAKNPATLSLLEMGEAAQKLYGHQSQKASQEFLLKGIDIANDCDLKYKVSQNQRLLVELALMQLSSIGFDGEKKKSDFIIPPTYYRRNDYSIAEITSTKYDIRSEDIVQSTKLEVQSVEKVEEPKTDNRQQTTDNRQPTTDSLQPKVSSMSLASIRAKKEMAEVQKSTVKDVVHLASAPFTETEMLEQWLKYAQRIEDKGYRIVASLLTINDPILEGTTIIHELPNESSKIDFEKEKPELLGYLRGKLHNHDITIDVKVNETLVLKKSYTPQDKYNRLAELNPNLELMRNLFGLEINE
jgi:DNA polymerase-3 subunit gamma/tau